MKRAMRALMIVLALSGPTGPGHAAPAARPVPAPALAAAPGPRVEAALIAAPALLRAGAIVHRR